MNTYFTRISFILTTIFITSCGGGDDPAPVSDCSTSDLSIAIAGNNPESCDSKGSLTASGSGGTGTLVYSIDGNIFQTSNQFTALDGGNYQVTVKDDDGCTASINTVVDSNVPTINVTSTEVDAGCGSSDGSITVSASGGDGNFTYSVNNGSFGTQNEFTDLTAGLYQIRAMDGNGCTELISVNVLSGIGYSTSVSSIITDNCAISGCHVDGTGRQDFSTISGVQANASGVKSRTQSGDMPRGGGSLTQEEIDLIACWVDDGAPSN